jgi:hypothetical protein
MEIRNYDHNLKRPSVSRRFWGRLGVPDPGRELDKQTIALVNNLTIVTHKHHRLCRDANKSILIKLMTPRRNQSRCSRPQSLVSLSRSRCRGPHRGCVRPRSSRWATHRWRKPDDCTGRAVDNHIHGSTERSRPIAGEDHGLRPSHVAMATDFAAQFSRGNPDRAPYPHQIAKSLARPLCTAIGFCATAWRKPWIDTGVA